MREASVSRSCWAADRAVMCRNRSLRSLRVISLVTPNSGQFYSPSEYHTGSHDQKAMIELCYNTVKGVSDYIRVSLEEYQGKIGEIN